MCLNYQGTLLATASEKGTLIRIFSTKSGTPLQELRRGAEKADIKSICFDMGSQWLACSSDRSTIHIFTVVKTDGNEKAIKLSDEEAKGMTPEEEQMLKEEERKA
jgi:WD repeat-containing protein 45